MPSLRLKNAFLWKMSSDSRRTNDAVLGQAIEHFSVILIYFQGTHSSPGAIFCHLQCCADPSAATFGSAASESASSLGGWKKKSLKGSEEEKAKMCILFPSLLHSIIKAISSIRKGQLAKFPLISILISTNPNYPFLQPLMMDHPPAFVSDVDKWGQWANKRR